MDDEPTRGDAPDGGRGASDTSEDLLATLFRSGRGNAMLAWPLVAVLGVTLVESVLDFDRLWVLFVAVTGAIVLVPPVAHRDWRVMLPWAGLVLPPAPLLVRRPFGRGRRAGGPRVGRRWPRRRPPRTR